MKGAFMNGKVLLVNTGSWPGESLLRQNGFDVTSPAL